MAGVTLLQAEEPLKAGGCWNGLPYGLDIVTLHFWPLALGNDGCLLLKPPRPLCSVLSKQTNISLAKKYPRCTWLGHICLEAKIVSYFIAQLSKELLIQPEVTGHWWAATCESFLPSPWIVLGGWSE